MKEMEFQFEKSDRILSMQEEFEHMYIQITPSLLSYICNDFVCVYLSSMFKIITVSTANETTFPHIRLSTPLKRNKVLIYFEVSLSAILN